MSRKDYQLIADVLAAQYAEHAPHHKNVSTPEAFVLDQVALALANALVAANPRFDKTRFLAACWSGTS